MKGYEFVKFAVVAIGLVLLALLASTVGTLAEAASFIDANTNHRHRNSQSGYKSNHIIHSHHRRKNSSKKNRMVCKPSSESFWIRNECHEGFLAIISDRRRVVTVNTAINEHDSTVEFVRETCEDPSAGLWDPVKTRLYSPSQHRYICFNKKGHLKSVRKRKAERMGDLCAFYERPIPSEHHSKYNSEKSPNLFFALQSAAHPGWYMGFGPHTPRARKFIGLRYSAAGQEISLPRRMGPWHLRKRHQKASRKSLVRPLGKCDFRFYMGIYHAYVDPTLTTTTTPSVSSIEIHSQVNPSPTWDGLFQSLELSNHQPSNHHPMPKLHSKQPPDHELENSNYPVRKTSSATYGANKKYHTPDPTHGISSSFLRP